jgi:hypothetical protein
MRARLDFPAGVRTEIYHLQGLIHMECARFALGIAAFVIVDSIGKVGVLLDFTDHHVWADGMRESRWNEESVTSVNFVRLKKVFQRVVR